jgi:hypothetical protein
MIKLATPSLRFIVYLLAAVLLAALATVLFGAHSGTAIAGAAAIPALGEVRVVVPDEEDYRHWGGHNELLQRWWRRVIEAAGSSSRLTEAERLVEAETKIDFANWLHGYVATAFYAAYERAESQWRLYAGVKELRDFKELRIKGRNRLQGFGYIGDHAHMPGMRRSYRPEASLFLDTYGAMHELTRQAIINQETDEILRDDPQDMGTAAAEYLANAIVALMTSNPTAPDGDPFYSLARGNLTTAEVSAASLMAAWTAFQTRKDETGLPIRITPRRLIVQNRTIGAIALREINSQQSAGQVSNPANADFVRGTDNPVAALPWPADFVVEEPFLPDFNDAYMVADPDRYPAFLVGMLRGQNQQPSLWQSAPEMQSVGGGGATSPYQLRIRKITWEVEWDLGVSAVNPDVAYAWRPA